MQRDEGLLVVFWGLSWHLELHVSNLLYEVLHCDSNSGPIHFLVSSEFRHGLLRRVVKTNNDLHHANRLGQRAHEIIVAEAVLLQEIFTDNLGDLKRTLLVLRQRILTNKLHDLLQVI